MFKNRVYLIFLVFFLFATTLLILVLSQGPCENCPATACSMACNSTLTDSTVTKKYYNFTLSKGSDILIRYRPLVNPFQEYNLYANETKDECPTNQSYDKAYFPGMGGYGFIYLPHSSEGTYHFLVDCPNAAYCENYELNLTCASFCGNNNWEYFEECDQTKKECDIPYERCVNCECFDFRWTEAVGCKYYDYCEDGMDVADVIKFNQGSINFDDIKSCCNYTSVSVPCCSLGGVPEKNCSVSGAVRNVSVTANPEYCYSRGYATIPDITDTCIDHQAYANTVYSYC